MSEATNSPTREKRTVSPRQRVLSDPATQVFFAILFFALLGWPVLQIAGAHGTLTVWLYLFVVWAGLIGFLFTLSRALGAPSEESE